MRAAQEYFFNDHSVKFSMEHAWRKLRHDQKWCSTYVTKDGGRQKRKPVQAEVDRQAEVGEPEERPVGVKAAKGVTKKKKSGREEELSSSSSDEVEERLEELFDEILEDTYNDVMEAQTYKQRKRAYIERNREAGHNRLWNDYFSEDATFSTHLFRRRFRMNKELFMRIVHALSENVPFF